MAKLAQDQIKSNTKLLHSLYFSLGDQNENLV